MAYKLKHQIYGIGDWEVWVEEVPDGRKPYGGSWVLPAIKESAEAEGYQFLFCGAGAKRSLELARAHEIAELLILGWNPFDMLFKGAPSGTMIKFNKVRTGVSTQIAFDYRGFLERCLKYAPEIDARWRAYLERHIHDAGARLINQSLKMGAAFVEALGETPVTVNTSDTYLRSACTWTRWGDYLLLLHRGQQVAFRVIKEPDPHFKIQVVCTGCPARWLKWERLHLEVNESTGKGYCPKCGKPLDVQQFFG